MFKNVIDIGDIACDYDGFTAEMSGMAKMKRLKDKLAEKEQHPCTGKKEKKNDMKR